MRLLLVVDSLDIGGAERHAVDLAVALHRQGHEVTVACTAGGPLAGELEWEGPAIRLLGRGLVKRRIGISFARELRRLVNEGGFDLVHSHTYASAVAAALATLGSRVPLVHTEHSEATWRSARARRVNRWIYRGAAQIIAVSHPIQRRLIDQDGATPNRVALIPNAVPDAPPVVSSALRRELRAEPRVGVIARLHPEKGVNTFLEALARIAAPAPALHALIIGDGPLRPELARQVRRLGLEERVHFLGLRSDARALLSYLDILVVPSVSEGAPLVVLEAMAAAVPVVACAVGGIPEQLRHGREGLLVPPEDPVALGEAVLDLLRHPEQARRLGEAGRQRAALQYRHTTMVQRIEDVYRSVLGLEDPAVALQDAAPLPA